LGTEPFYKDGLRFSCRRCSLCCTSGPGFVFLTGNDLKRLAAHFRMGGEAFIKEYCRPVNWFGSSGVLSLKEKSNYDCIFWNAGCTVYEARPVQCRTYPFWKKFLESEKAWESMTAECPGAGSGELRSAQFIEECIKAEDEKYISV